MIDDCVCIIEQELFDDALEEAAKEPDEQTRLRSIRILQSMRKEVFETFLPKHACEKCPFRKTP